MLSARRFTRLASQRDFSTLVVADQFGGSFGSFKSAVTAASKFSEPIHVLTPAKDTSKFATAAAKTKGVEKVLSAKHELLENPMASHLASIVKHLVEKNGYNRVICASSSTGKDFLPRVAAQMDSQPITDVIDIVDANTFVRPVYAGNAISTVKSKDKVKFISVRPTNFVQAKEGGSGTIEEIDVSAFLSKDKGEFLENIVQESDTPDLASAEYVISGGRALKSAANFKILYDLAKKLGNCAVGASRAAVDAGYVPNDLQVGQTGKVVAPKLYIAIGISGAIQHVAGMKDSKTIVAINKDGDAPIFEIADYGLVGDLFEIVKELNEKL